MNNYYNEFSEVKMAGWLGKGFASQLEGIKNQERTTMKQDKLSSNYLENYEPNCPLTITRIMSQAVLKLSPEL